MNTMTDEEHNLYLCLLFPLIDITSGGQRLINMNGKNELHLVQVLLGSKLKDINFHEGKPFVAGDLPLVDYIKKYAGKRHRQIYGYMVDHKTDFKNVIAMILENEAYLSNSVIHNLTNKLVIDDDFTQ